MSALRFRGWMPLGLVGVLLVAIGAYAASRSDAFLSEFNLNNLLLATLPLALVAIGQANALLVGGFDVSVGALMTICVVAASFTMPDPSAWYVLIPGGLALLGIGLATGVFNAFLIRSIGLPSIIATLGTLSILLGLALLLRPVPEGPIDSGLVSALRTSVGFVPVAFVGVIVLAVAWDYWLYRTPAGLSVRAVGLDETSARRLGARTARVHVLAFLLSALMAAVAAFFLAAEVGVGAPNVGQGYALQSIAAAVLGGASLAGGRGSFVGAVLGALLLSLILNVLPLLQWPTAYGPIAIGGLTLLALVLYQGPALFARLRAAWEDSRQARSALAGAHPE